MRTPFTSSLESFLDAKENHASNPDPTVFTKQSHERMYIWLTNRVRKEKVSVVVGSG